MAISKTNAQTNAQTHCHKVNWLQRRLEDAESKTNGKALSGQELLGIEASVQSHRLETDTESSVIS